LGESKVVVSGVPLDEGLKQKRLKSKNLESVGYETDCNWNNLLPCLDNWLWANIPSAFGLHIGLSGQVGIGIIEPGIVPAEFLLLANWRSGEISLYYTYEAFLYSGTPSLFGGNVYGGWTTIKGLSRNQFYEGSALYTGATLSADAFGKLGIVKVKGWAQDPESLKGIPTSVFVDPISLHPVTYEQTSVTVGGNLLGNGVDGGIMGGYAYTTQIWP
jgi:hypothetical protein